MPAQHDSDEKEAADRKPQPADDAADEDVKADPTADEKTATKPKTGATDDVGAARAGLSGPADSSSADSAYSGVSGSRAAGSGAGDADSQDRTQPDDSEVGATPTASTVNADPSTAQSKPHAPPATARATDASPAPEPTTSPPRVKTGSIGGQAPDALSATPPPSDTVEVTPDAAAQRSAPSALRLATPAPSMNTDPVGFVVSYVSDVVTGVVNVVLNPLASAGGFPTPVGTPTLWTLLAFARRESFNGSPSIHYRPGHNQQTSGQVFGDVGATDPDGDRLTYTVVGSPVNGGKVRLEPATGNFVYTPTRAMAAFGGTDRFTVVVSDEGSGLHMHGPLGLARFMPVASPLLTVLSALPGVGSLISPIVTVLRQLPVARELLHPYATHADVETITVTVAPTPGQDLSFPEGFHWGVATSAFQSEMGGGAPNAVNSDEWKFLHDPINRLLGLAPGLPENGPGGYQLYATDARLVADGVGADSYRTSIEWSRIFPNSTNAVDVTDEGGEITEADLQALDALADQAEVRQYRAVFDALRTEGLDPMVTVNHYTLPTWIQDPTTLGGDRLALQLGLPGSQTGWLDPDTSEEFAKYAAYIAWKYGGQVDNYVVLNEPNVYPLGGLLYLPRGPAPGFPPGVFRPDLISTFLVNEANAYVMAYDAMHRWDTTVASEEAADDAAFVGFANSMSMFRPSDPSNPLDVQAAEDFNNFYNRWFADAVIKGEVDANLDGVITADEVHPDMAGKADYIGVNYYGTGTISGVGAPLLPGLPAATGLPSRTFTVATCPTSECSSDTGQPVDPGGLREVLEIATSYGKPIWITENGIANGDDSQRAGYIVKHLAVVQSAIADDGMDIRGYTYWSLTDVLEWSNGYEPKFGLYSFDPVTLERTARPSVAIVHQITTANALPTDLLASYLPGASVPSVAV